MNPARTDVLILGGGVIGLTCALALLKDGASVRIVEQGEPGSGSSHGNCGTITPSHASPLTLPSTIGVALRSLLRRDAPLYLNPRMTPARLRWLLRFARHCSWSHYRRAGQARAALLAYSRTALAQLIASDGLACDFRETGELYVYRDARSLQADVPHADLLRELGMVAEPMDAAAVAAFEPALRDGVVGGLFHPGDAQLRPDRFVAELARRVRERGGIIETQCAIEGFSTGDQGITAVRTSRGDFSGTQVVLALGAWSALSARLLGMRVPVQPGKGYSITWKTPPRLAPLRSLVLREAGVCVTTWADGYRLGSTMEFSGFAAGLNEVRLAALRKGAARYLHEPEGTDLAERWWGWRPMSVDEIPLIGRSARHRNLILATGHGMLGISMSAGTADMVAAIVRGDPAAIDPAPFAPGRFGL